MHVEYAAHLGLYNIIINISRFKDTYKPHHQLEVRTKTKDHRKASTVETHTMHCSDHRPLSSSSSSSQNNGLLAIGSVPRYAGYAEAYSLPCMVWPNRIIFTHRRSIAERGGCFQRRLFVCQFVSMFFRTITSERLNLGRSHFCG